MNYIASIVVENYNSERLRAFADEGCARRYVTRLADRLSGLRAKGRTRMFVIYATVYTIEPSGSMSVVAMFEGGDPREDYWHLWR